MYHRLSMFNINIMMLKLYKAGWTCLSFSVNTIILYLWLYVILWAAHTAHERLLERLTMRTRAHESESKSVSESCTDGPNLRQEHGQIFYFFLMIGQLTHQSDAQKSKDVVFAVRMSRKEWWRTMSALTGECFEHWLWECTPCFRRSTADDRHRRSVGGP